MLREFFVGSGNAYDVQVEIKWLMEAEPTFNDFELTEQIRKITEQWYDKVIYPEPSSAGEDFANYQKQALSFFAFIGSMDQRLLDFTFLICLSKMKH